jgi:hypothetical protein
MYDSTISTAAVKDQMKEVNFQVFPNPSTGSINVRCEHPVKEIKITNTWGQTVFAESPNSNTVHFELQISGVYFVTISDGKSVMTKKCSVLK